MSDSRFQLDRVKGAPVSNADLLADLQYVAEAAGTKFVSQALYVQFGKYDCTTVVRRFGSWNKGVISAGLETANEINYSEERLFENILRLWEYYGDNHVAQNYRINLPRSLRALTIGALVLG